MSKLLIWGAGGHGKVVLDIALDSGLFESIAFLDDEPSKAGNQFCGHSVFGTKSIQEFEGHHFVMALGDNHQRAERFLQGQSNGLIPVVLVHRRATVSPSARLGFGTVVMAGVVINADVTIRENCIVNSGAVVEHDCHLSAHVHVSPRAILGGNVKVGEYAHIGLGAVMLPGSVAERSCVVGAGAVVLKNVPANSTVVGVPARLLPHS